MYPNDRLLDEGIYSAKEGHISLLELSCFVRFSANLGEPIDTFKLGGKYNNRSRFLATRFDQVWMDQRITALGLDKRAGAPIDASEFFRE